MKSYMTQRLDEYRDGNEDKGRLLVSCPDQPGIVSAVSAFLFEHGANIIESNQYTTDPEGVSVLPENRIRLRRHS